MLRRWVFLAGLVAGTAWAEEPAPPTEAPPEPATAEIGFFGGRMSGKNLKWEGSTGGVHFVWHLNPEIAIGPELGVVYVPSSVSDLDTAIQAGWLGRYYFAPGRARAYALAGLYVAVPGPVPGITGGLGAQFDLAPERFAVQVEARGLVYPGTSFASLSATGGLVVRW